jgi:hypothetical protein
MSAQPAMSANENELLPASGNSDPYAAYRFVGNAFALVVLAAALAEFVWNWRHPTDRDFLGFWGAARLALAGNPSAAYDNGALHAVQSAAATFGSRFTELPFPYPPAYLLFVIPFGLMTFPLAMAVWSVCTFALYLFAARRLMPGSGWLAAAFPAVFANAAIGQNGFLTAGLFTGGLSLLGTSPFAAGLVLGCLIIKPQLAILLPVALAAGRHWHAIAGAALSSAGLMLLGLVLFGTGATAAWLYEAPLLARIMDEGLVGWSKLASVYGAARQLGIGPGAAIAVHGIVALAAAALVWRIWRSQAEAAVKVAVLAAASMLMSPYLFLYDGLILVPAFVWLARESRRYGVLLALWCLPLLMIGQIALFGASVNLNPVAPIALLALLWRHFQTDHGDVYLRNSAATLRIWKRSRVSISQLVGR